MVQPNQVWLTDITYTLTYAGWLYLKVVFYPYSRAVVGWFIKSITAGEIMLDALVMAMWRSHPKAPVMIHADKAQLVW